MSELSAATLLRLMWLASPGLPVGGFSYSEGLEAAVDAGAVTRRDEACEWLGHQLQLQLARCDLPVAAQALRAWRECDSRDGQAPDAIRRLNDWVLCTRETSEMRLQTEQMGRSLVEWMRHGQGTDDPRVAWCAALPPAPTWPVAFALAAESSAASVEATLLAMAFSWAENMVQAAMKAVPLGQVAAQHILQRLSDDIPRAVRHAQDLPLQDCQAFAPMLAILSSRHEAQYSRLFRS